LSIQGKKPDTIYRDNLENHLIEQKPDMPDQSIILESLGKDPNFSVWNPQQTLLGVLLTLIPWIAFNLVSTALGSNSPSAPALTPGQDLVGAFVAFVLSAVLEGIFLIAPYYYAQKALVSQNLLAAQAAVKVRVQAVFQALGLRRFKPGRALLWIVGLMILIIVVDLLYAYVISVLHLNIQTNDQVVLQESATEPLTVYGLLAASIFVAPLCEETFFRGFVFTGLLRELSPIWAMLVSAALFAIAHLDPGSFVPLFAIGIALAFLRWRTGSTWPGIILHMLNNSLSTLLIILAIHNVNVNLPF
jgi:membrane protease YdiL (CAAX protease family)